MYACRQAAKKGAKHREEKAIGSDPLLPDVLLSLCFSFLHGSDRQSVSLVCKSWCRLEKAPASWPNKLRFHGRISGVSPLSVRLQGKRFDRVFVGSFSLSSLKALLQGVRVKDLTLAEHCSVFEILNHMTFSSSIESLSFHLTEYDAPETKLLARLPSLTALTLDGSDNAEFDELMAACPNLKSLTFPIDWDLDCITAVRQLTCLEHLEITSVLGFEWFVELCNEVARLPA